MLEDNKHKAIFKGETVREMYRAYNFFNSMLMRTYDKHVCWKDIHECFLDRPLIEVNETVYINELDKEVNISRRVRTTNGEIIYYINNYEIIKDEESIESKNKAQEEINEYDKQKQSKKEEVLQSSKTNKKWWHFWL